MPALWCVAKIFLALLRGGLLAIPPPLNYAGKTAAESGRTWSTIVPLRDGAPICPRPAGFRADRRLDGKSAANRGRWKTEGARRSRDAAQRCPLGNDLQTRLEITGLLQSSHDRLLRD